MASYTHLPFYEGNEPYIYISYSHKNSDQVLPIIAAMQNTGFRIWFDQGIEAYTEWVGCLESHIQNCDTVLVFMSKAATESRCCRDEISFALTLKKEILVVYLEEITLPPSLALRLNFAQYIPAYRYETEEAFYEQLFSVSILQDCRDTHSTPEAETSPIASEGLQFDLSEDGASYDCIGIGTCTDTDVVLPKTYCEKAVTGIGSFAFSGFRLLKSLSVPDSVTRIGSGAFRGCTLLNCVSLGEHVTTIGTFAFADCESLATVSIPSSVTSIENFAFSHCASLVSISVPNGVTTIGGGAFSHCTSLTSIAVPDSITNIGREMFSWCTSLTSISLPSGVTSIEKEAFFSCESLTNISIPNSVKTIGSKTFAWCKSLICIFYGGTKDAWQQMQIDGTAFTGCSLITVHCTDGDIVINN